MGRGLGNPSPIYLYLDFTIQFDKILGGREDKKEARIKSFTFSLLFHLIVCRRQPTKEQ